MASAMRSMAWVLVYTRALRRGVLKAWKAGMESKGPRVNMKKNKFMVSGVDLDFLETGKYPCAVSCKGVGDNSIECS